MELHELHVLHGQACSQHHATAVAGAGMRRSAGEIGAAIAACGEHGHVRAETMQLPGGQIQGHHTAAGTVLHDEIDGKEFDEELRIGLQRLLVQRVQHRVAGAIGCGAGALRNALAVIRGHAAKGALVDAAISRARERHTVVLKLDYRRGSFLAHEFDRVLVTEPVGSLDGVVHMPAPVVFAHVGERGADATLRRHGVAAGWKYLGDAGGVEPGFGHAQRCTQARATGADHDDVRGVIHKTVRGHCRVNPSAQRSARRRCRQLPAAHAQPCSMQVIGTGWPCHAHSPR